MSNIKYIHVPETAHGYIKKISNKKNERHPSKEYRI